MTENRSAPPWARPVLEELRGFADAAWRGLASQDRVTAAWAGAMRDAITAALASDAGTPEKEPFFHKLGCPQISGTTAHCTCQHDRPKQSTGGTDGMDAASLAEHDGVGEGQRAGVSVPLREVDPSVAAADPAVGGPDAELDRLISEYGRAHARAMELMSWPNDTPQCRAAIHAHVERVKREAYADGHRAGARIMAQVHRDSRREKEEG